MKRALGWLSIALCLAIASPLFAFQRETTDDDDCDEDIGVNCAHRGTALAWRSDPVLFYINNFGSGIDFGDALDAARSAFSTWQDASNDHIVFEFGGETNGGSDGNDGRNTIHFPSLGGGASDTFAQSVLTYDSRTGEIFDVDVELNGDEPFAILPEGQVNAFDPRVDLQSVLTHEAGHVLGLAHENRFGTSTVMFFSDTSGNTTHRKLTADDRSGVRAIYPAAIGLPDGGDDQDDDDGGGGGGGCRVDPSAGPTSLSAVLALIGWLVLRKSGRSLAVLERRDARVP